jgi:ribosomal protein L37AE/L43A
MAKTVIVGSSERKVSYCPQCRKPIPKESRTENGVKCPRCGFFNWADFAKYPPFMNIPEPGPEDSAKVNELFDGRTKKEAEE